jgi:hypothetical protein
MKAFSPRRRKTPGPTRGKGSGSATVGRCLTLVRLFFLLSAVLVWEAQGTLVPEMDPARLCDTADLVIVGRVRARHQQGWTTIQAGNSALDARLYAVTVDVEKYLKGAPAGETVGFTFALSDTPVGHKGIQVGQFGIYFLSRTEEGLRVLDPYYPSLPAAPGAPPFHGKLVDSVATELAHVFVSSDTSVQSRWTRWEAVRALETLQTGSATAGLRVAAGDKEPLVRVWAMAALLKRGDISMLEQIEKLGRIPPDPHVQNLTAHLGFAIERVKDMRAIPSLGRLLHSADVNIRRGAAGGLRNTQDKAAIKPLTEALHDTDREVQYQAVIGLAEITGAPSEWSPASATFEKDPNKYLDYWRDWAKSRTPNE